MKISYETLLKKIFDGIYDVMGYTIKDRNETRTFESHSMDSLDVVELIMYLEDKMDLDFGYVDDCDNLEYYTIRKFVSLLIQCPYLEITDSKEVVESRDDKIIRLHNTGMSQNEIARSTSIPRSTVGDVVRRHKGIQKQTVGLKVSWKVDQTQDESYVTEMKKLEHIPVVSWNASYDFINCFIDGVPFIADRSHPRFEDAFNILIKNNDVIGAVNLISIKEAIKTYSSGDIRIEGDTLYYKDIELDTSMTRRIVDMWASGEEFEYMVLFLKNLLQNPRRAAVYELFDFLTHSDIKLSKDGHFLAYKRVTPDYMDIRTRTFDNSIGAKPTMEPFAVDDDRNNTCAAGLHAAASHYIPYYSSCKDDRVILVKINPAHVVAIPTDYNNAKLRTWTYEVLEDVTHEFK